MKQIKQQHQCMKPIGTRRCKNHHKRPAVRVSKDRAASVAHTPRFGVWDPRETLGDDPRSYHLRAKNWSMAQ